MLGHDWLSRNYTFGNQPLHQRLVKYSILLSIKESYLFVRNWIGLIFHPFKTLRALFREQDFSQILLVIGFPAYFFVGGLGFIWLGRRIIDAPPGQWGILTKSGVSLVTLVAFITFIYLGFWLWQVYKSRRT